MNTVKTFRAADPRAALNAVKAALGAEAVILQTRQVGGGLWGKPQIEVTAARSTEAARAGGPRDALETEVAALRRVVEELRREVRSSSRDDTRPVPGESVNPAGLRLLRRLTGRGVEEMMAQEIVKLALLEAAPRDNDLMAAAGDLVRKRLPPARAPWEKSESRVLALIGPTGAGKTTTVAKIAARALLESRLKVSLITVDTYRIGASEHIGRYGEIMGIPTHVARDAASLREAVARSSEADLVLVDTAGRPDPAAIAAQNELLRSIPDLELHLVLPAMAGAREIRAMARRYESCGVQRLIFSKLDESDGPGCVLSAAAILARPVSCMTDGQRVPEDIHPGTAPRLIDLVIGR